MHHIERISAALREAASRGAINAALRPAMVGCPDCLTFQAIMSPAPFGDCPACGARHTRLAEA